ncbi:YlxM family DNA-binding protein [Floccifex sp.]|uniref:YlxM family DNA-binding protein n=1 Tax=Floccifex sp. TaxID=2815810 RepID=UPI003EFBD3FC
MLDHFVMNELFDVYGQLLTKRQQEILQLYCQEDLSLSEISEELHISRAAVLDAIHKSIHQLEKFESVVQYVRKRNQLFALVEDNQSLSEKIRSIF